MAADPMTCRRHANACLRLAETAKTSELGTALLSLAQSWARLDRALRNGLARPVRNRALYRSHSACS